MLSNNNLNTKTTPFIGLRPIEPSEVESFWNSVNFKIGKSQIKLDELEDFEEEFFENSAIMPPSKKVKSNFLSFEKISEDQSMNYIVPFSFPKPDPSSFVQYYAPFEPHILLPNYFKIHLDSLEEIINTLENYLKTSKNINFSSCGSTWSGNFSNTSFRLCIYKSRKEENIYIIEAQRISGDGFIFGNFYQEIKKLFKN